MVLVGIKICRRFSSISLFNMGLLQFNKDGQYFTLPPLVRAESAQTLRLRELSEDCPSELSEWSPRTVRVVQSDYTQTDLVVNIYTFEILSELSPSSLPARLVEICTKSHKIMCAEQELNHRPLHYESHDCQSWTLNHLSQMVIVKYVTNVYLLPLESIIKLDWF
jgi:hypothetical protein